MDVSSFGASQKGKKEGKRLKSESIRCVIYDSQLLMVQSYLGQKKKEKRKEAEFIKLKRKKFSFLMIIKKEKYLQLRLYNILNKR